MASEAEKYDIMTSVRFENIWKMNSVERRHHMEPRVVFFRSTSNTFVLSICNIEVIIFLQFLLPHFGPIIGFKVQLNS